LQAKNGLAYFAVFFADEKKKFFNVETRSTGKQLNAFASDVVLTGVVGGLKTLPTDVVLLPTV